MKTRCALPRLVLRFYNFITLKQRAFLAAALILPSLAFGQTLDKSVSGKTQASTNAVARMEEVVVTATRSEVKVDEAPARVSVVTREQMEKMHITTLDDALKHEAGLFERRTKGTADSTARVQLRGLESAKRTLIMINGIPMNSGYAGDQSWAQISTENVERIEVIRGPASALYGGNAMGGAVNIITKKPARLEMTGKAGFGDDNTIRHSFSFGDRLDDTFTLRVGYEVEETDGYVTTPVNSTVARSTAGTRPTLAGGNLTTSTAGATQLNVGDKGDNYSNRWNANMELGCKLTETGELTITGQVGEYGYGYGVPHSYLSDRNGAGGQVNGYADAGGGNRSALLNPASFFSSTGISEDQLSLGSVRYEDQYGGLHSLAKIGIQYDDSFYTQPSGSTANLTYDNSPGSMTKAVTRSWFGDWQGTMEVFPEHTFTFGTYFRYDDFDQDNYRMGYFLAP
ncbi:MAG: TonB-dependent receptor plug domain-containing protein, partial [Verrucomicrobiae bacterium]|nr:TonB-dependent receptor plug domain-containing protein [Verrucomicrobiae bacterium]